MELRPLGATGIDVSAISLGTVKLGRNQALKYGPFDLPSDEVAGALLADAADVGINLIDTAPAYGTSESRLGALLGPYGDRFLVSTKAGEEFEGGVSRFDFSPEHTIASVERSARRLGRDVLDVVLIHSDGDDLAILEMGTFDALRACKDRGLVRAIGMSPKSVAGARAAIPHADVLMVALNPRDREMAPVVAEAREAGVGVLVKKGLLSGDLEGVDAGRDPVESCMEYLLGEPGVSSVVTGTINPDHLRHNAQAASRVTQS